jgi:hypothetical protein
MKGLPTGMQYFKEIIENNYLYVDKTEFIHKIASTGKFYFLSRPRRFGKSLLVSTLEELFKGNKNLFKNLYIYDKWNWEDNFPVIKVDFGEISHDSSSNLKLSLIKFLKDTATTENIELEDIDLLPDKFSELIKKLHDKTGKQVVVLIDEYDKPIIKHLDDIKLSESNRDVLSSFYQVLKTNDMYLRFVFLTGVSKFSKTSIFSELNNLDDLTLDPSFANICGYTQEELENYFHQYIKELTQDNNTSKEFLLEAIETWYDGYSWDGLTSLYNPYSILLLFKKGEFNNYWFDTGSPTFLIDLIMKNPKNINTFLNPENKIAGSFPSFDFEKIDLTTILLQSGYLTIKNKKAALGKLPEYSLAIPNKEVHDSFYSHLLSYFTNLNAGSIQPMAEDMLNYIIANDEFNLTKSFETLLNNISSILHERIENINEAYYHLLFTSWLQILGFDVTNENRSLGGDADTILRINDLIIIIEYKYSTKLSLESMLNEGMKQIKNKGYHKPYQNKKLIFVSIATKPKEVACKIEKYN